MFNLAYIEYGARGFQGGRIAITYSVRNNWVGGDLVLVTFVECIIRDVRLLPFVCLL